MFKSLNSNKKSNLSADNQQWLSLLITFRTHCIWHLNKLFRWNQVTNDQFIGNIHSSLFWIITHWRASLFINYYWLTGKSVISCFSEKKRIFAIDRWSEVSRWASKNCDWNWMAIGAWSFVLRDEIGTQFPFTRQTCTYTHFIHLTMTQCIPHTNAFCFVCLLVLSFHIKCWRRKFERKKKKN